jgi:hypothetical protein
VMMITQTEFLMAFLLSILLSLAAIFFLVISFYLHTIVPLNTNQLPWLDEPLCHHTDQLEEQVGIDRECL